MRPQFWRDVFVAVTLGLWLIYGAWWVRMITTPRERVATDFIALYAAARIAEQHGFRAVYDLSLQRQIEESIVGFPLAPRQVLIFNHPPQFLPILRAVVDDNFTWSFVRWAVLLTAVSIVATVLLTQAVFAEQDFPVRVMIAAGVLTFFPLFVSLWQGQETAFLLLGFVLWFRGLKTGRAALVAIGLALATIRPHLAVPLALALWRPYPGAWWRFVAYGGAVVLFSLALVGLEGVQGMLELIRISSQGEWFGVRPERMLNLRGALHRGFPWLGPGLLDGVAWCFYALSIGVVAVLWARAKRIDERLVGLSVILVLAAVPHIHTHDLAILVIPILCALRLSTFSLSAQPWRLLVLSMTSMALLVSIQFDALRSVVPYVVYAVLGWHLMRAERHAVDALR